MVIIKNDCILVTKDDPSFSILRSDLTFFNSGVRKIYKKRKDGGTYVINQSYNNTEKIYQIYNNGISIPRGLLQYINPYISDSVIIDKQNKSKFFDVTINKSEIEHYSTILDGITLEIEQIVAIRKMIMCKRCIIQSATGCFTGDTHIPLLNGYSKSFEELINMDYNKEYVYTCTKDGDISFSKIKSVHITKYVTKLLKITLDDDTVIQCTPEHPFMLRNGQYKQAQDLLETDSLMSYDCVFDCKGNKAVKHNKYCSEKRNLISILNHRIRKIEILELSSSIPVYDLETESDLHNFAIQTSFKDKDHEFIGSGIFVHNSGKTEIMCGFLEILKDKIGIYPTTLIVEPTVSILNGTIKRFNKYNIPIFNYRETRSIINNGINICHPKSLVNDLKSNPDLLNDLNVVIGDEVHHMKSILFRTPSDNANAIDYSIGLSASAIQTDHVGKNNMNSYSADELNIIGSTGPLVMNVTSGHLIESGRLATPVVLAMNNPADEPIPEIEITNWHRIVSDKLYSMYRTHVTCETAQFFSKNNRKVLILVNTIEWSRLLMKHIYKINPELGLYGTRASYGGGKFEYFNGQDFIDDHSDVLDKFSNGNHSILIGTSHLYEGIDVSNLDVIILAFGGKKERMVFQGIGRALRKTKNGKYAYIVDFNDTNDPVLNSQFRKRSRMYKEVMRIPDNMFFNNVEIDELEGIFNKLEN